MQEIQPQVTGFGWQDRFQNMMQHPIVRIIVQLVILLGVVFVIKEFALKPVLRVLISDEETRINIQGLPMAIHTGWNFTQVLWGTRVSGVDTFGSYVEATTEGPVWATGGEVGIEGSYFCIAVVILVTLALYALARKNNVIIKYQH